MNRNSKSSEKKSRDWWERGLNFWVRYNLGDKVFDKYQRNDSYDVKEWVLSELGREETEFLYGELWGLRDIHIETYNFTYSCADDLLNELKQNGIDVSFLYKLRDAIKESVALWKELIDAKDGYISLCLQAIPNKTGKIIYKIDPRLRIKISQIMIKDNVDPSEEAFSSWINSYIRERHLFFMNTNFYRVAEVSTYNEAKQCINEEFLEVMIPEYVDQLRGWSHDLSSRSNMWLETPGNRQKVIEHQIKLN